MNATVGTIGEITSPLLILDARSRSSRLDHRLDVCTSCRARRVLLIGASRTGAEYYAQATGLAPQA